MPWDEADRELRGRNEYRKPRSSDVYLLILGKFFCRCKRSAIVQNPVSCLYVTVRCLSGPSVWQDSGDAAIHHPVAHAHQQPAVICHCLHVLLFFLFFLQNETDKHAYNESQAHENYLR